jgi:membrane fusion protein, multidrug efflux system
VRHGLQEGDVIVVSGLQRVRPGASVTPRMVSMATSQRSQTSDASTQSALIHPEEKSHGQKVRE